MPLACTCVYGGAIALMVGLNGGGVILRLRVCIERKTEVKKIENGAFLEIDMHCITNGRTEGRYYWNPTE